MRTVFITGANRGIGLEFARAFLKLGDRVLACCRNPDRASELRTLEGDSCAIFQLDVTNAEHQAQLKSDLQDQPIDILINNAGVIGSKQPIGELDYDDWREVMQTNLYAPVRLVELFLDNLIAGQTKRIVNITSKMGSVDDNSSGGRYSYRTSKAGLNIATKSLAVDLAQHGIVAVVMHPGWVRTGMGGKGAAISTEQSVSGMLRVVEELSPEQSGKFFAYDGSEIPW